MTDHTDDIRALRDRMDAQHDALRSELTEYQLQNERRFGELSQSIAGLSKLIAVVGGTILGVLTGLQLLGIL